VVPRRLTRYIFSECWTFFLLCLVAFTGVLFTIRLLKFSALIINKGVAISQIGWVFISIIPTFLEFALPLSALLGVMLAGARLSGDSEIVVLRASGISIFQLIRPLLLFSFIVIMLAASVTFILKPWGYQTLAETLFDIARTTSTAGLEAGTFNRIGPLTIYAEKIIDATGELEGVMIDDRRGDGQRKIIFAKNGRITSRPKTRSITFDLYDGSIHEMISGDYLTTRFQTNSLTLNSDELSDPGAKQRGTAPRELSVRELRGVIPYFVEFEDSLRRSGNTGLTTEPLPPAIQKHFNESSIDLGMVSKKRRRLEVELEQRWSMPCAAALLGLLALPLGIQPPRAQRMWGLGLSVGVGVAVFVLYYGLLSMGLALVENGFVSTLIGVWLPNLITAVIAALLTFQIGSERWASIADLVGATSRVWCRFAGAIFPSWRNEL
jgi:lipopolysaccharide export system permease protein